MKLMRYGAKGAEKPGLIDAQGQVRALSGVIADITPQTLGRKGWRNCARSTHRNCRWWKPRVASQRRGAAAASSCASA
jgi:hypothetical protein